MARPGANGWAESQDERWLSRDILSPAGLGTKRGKSLLHEKELENGRTKSDHKLSYVRQEKHRFLLFSQPWLLLATFALVTRRFCLDTFGYFFPGNRWGSGKISF